MSENYFELSILPFLGLHLLFNVELLQPYFPPLLHTSEVVEHLSHTQINLDNIEHATFDQIMVTNMKINL